MLRLFNARQNRSVHLLRLSPAKQDPALPILRMTALCLHKSLPRSAAALPNTAMLRHREAILCLAFTKHCCAQQYDASAIRRIARPGYAMPMLGIAKLSLCLGTPWAALPLLGDVVRSFSNAEQLYALRF
jgi:hypothetical protein